MRDRLPSQGSYLLFSREKSKTKESEIGELYVGLLQSIFVVSKFGIYLLDPSHMIKRNVYHV